MKEFVALKNGEYEAAVARERQEHEAVAALALISIPPGAKFRARGILAPARRLSLTVGSVTW